MHDSFPHKDLADYLKLESYDGLVEFLKEQGFEIYNVYSIKDGTSITMSSVFEISSSIPNDERSLGPIMVGDNRVNLLLQSKGYRTGMGRNSYFSQDFPFLFYDFSLSDDISQDTIKSNDVLLAILQGRLNSMLFTKTTGGHRTKGAAEFAAQQKNKDKILLWAWGGPGHTTTRLQTMEQEFAHWKPRFELAVIDIMNEIKIISKNDDSSIIIIMSDHGPSLLRDKRSNDYGSDESKINSIHFRDQYGAFMAIRWPDKKRAAKYDRDFQVDQDLFPIVFSYLYDSPIPLKYRITDTALRIKDHKFDRGVFYPYFYKTNNKHTQ
jgi:hypothetical protein